MKIATYNVNSIKARSANLCKWLKDTNPDIVFLQEIKCETEQFLYFECESMGYKTVAHGQKAYNGVAILSKFEFEITAKNLPNFTEDINARYLEVLIRNGNESFYAVSVYVPNGSTANTNLLGEKFDYKLKWLDYFYNRMCFLKNTGVPVIVGGDFNIIMSELDVFNEDFFKDGPLYCKSVQNKIIALEYAGFHDAFRLLHPGKEGYTFWDYTANSFVTNSGLRIDYIFVTARLAEKLRDCWVDKTARSIEKPSDHTALIAEFEDFDD